MSKTLTPEKALIFRIVHRDNFPEIVKDGCYCRSRAEENKYVEIGNEELIAKRSTREVPIDPGGTLSEYVPFYFTPFSPMLYNIKTGYNGIPKKPMSDILILVSSLHDIKNHGAQFIFSDRHAYLKTAMFSDNVDNLKDWIIWQELQARNFKKDNIDRFEKYQAEALVYEHVPVSLLNGVVCYNDVVKDEMQAIADTHPVELKIISQPKWYL